jgi:hypothetical protein
VPVHIIKKTSHMLAEGIINDDEGLAAATAIGLGLLPYESAPAAIHRVFLPGGLRKNTREIRFVGALEDVARHMGQALVGQDDPPGQVVLEMPQLALVVKHVAEDRGVVVDHGSTRRKRQFHHASPLSFVGVFGRVQG